jgi:hypothetical protein
LTVAHEGEFASNGEGESQPPVCRQTVGVAQVGERVSLVTFIRDDLG